MLCFNDNCSKKIALIIGDCIYCNEQFCLKHRLPESHDCKNKKLCNLSYYEKNKSKLLKNALTSKKI